MNANERKQHKRQTIKGSLAAHPESTKTRVCEQPGKRKEGIQTIVEI